jgi:ergothioneine biosynthesis protein EgtB
MESAPASNTSLGSSPGPSLESSPGSAPASLVGRYTSVRASTEGLCAPLSAEDAALQSMPDASPAKWHLAHTSWFFETFVLRPGMAGYRVFDPGYEMLFNSYYRSVGEPYPRPRRGLLSRPSLEEVLRYRRHVDQAMGELLSAAGRPERGELLGVVELGLQHEQQHQELLLTDVKHLLYQNPLRPAYRSAGGAPAVSGAARRLDFVGFPGGFAAIGHAGPGFAFDNEGPRHRRWLEPFALATRLVTNGEWMAFIADRGYERPELWLSDGFDAVTGGGWRAPLYWERDGQGFAHFTLEGMQPLRPEEPVCHVSAYEADAFARWAGVRLPGEDEWEVGAADRPVAGNFVESARLGPAAAGPAEPPAQLFGDVWEWTRSPYAAYPGYAPPPGALGEYNGKFMCNQLVLRGGSCATPRSHLRASYRNFFPPGARWQFSGVRLARDAR